MEEPHPPNEPSNANMSLPDQTENNTDDDEQSLSPQQQSSSESEHAASTPNDEVSNNKIQAPSSDDNSESEEHTSNVSDMNGNITDSDVVSHTPSVATVNTSTTDQASFTCKYPGCAFTSDDAEVYLKHEDTHVEGGSTFCDICNARFPTYAIMRRHHLYMHQGIRTFECQFCTKRFLRKEQFLEHLMAHTKPRPYQCSFCGGTFGFRGQLKSHLTTEHSHFVDKSCHLCDFRASSPNAVKQHYNTFHLQQNLEISNSNGPHDLIRRVPINPNDNGAIDLAAVSQNFSLMAAHYQPYLTRDVSTMLPGPSDLSRTSNLNSLVANAPNYITPSVDQNVNVPVPENTRLASIGSIAGSTGISPAVVSPTTGPNTEQTRSLSQDKVAVKPEPSELVVDDSQNSNVQPTSTMDLSMTDVVETTCSTSNETPCRRKVHKHSCTDDTGLGNQCLPSNRQCSESQMVPSGMRTTHTCCRFRPYDESGSQRCREYSRHTCTGHRHSIDRRSRFSDSDIDRNSQSDEDRKVFYSRATSTNLLGPGEVHISRMNNASAIHNEGNSNDANAESNCFNNNRKNTIVIRDIESCTLTCVYCNIIFPDQTLYLLHRSLHSEASPWKCNLCGKTCKDKYDFNSHVISKGHY